MRYEAVYLDRDGVLNVDHGDYITRPDDLTLIPGAVAAVRRLNDTGVPVVVVTNQAGIGRGRFGPEVLAAIHARLEAELAAGGARLDAVYHCPHHPDDGCGCRKPQAGMLRDAAAALGFAPERAVLIGDNMTDLQAAWAAGADAILVRTGHGRRTEGQLADQDRQPVAVVEDLPAAVEWLLR